MKAVIWTDVFQSFIILAGLIAVVTKVGSVTVLFILMIILD